MKTSNKSIIEVSIYGKDILIHEYYSRGKIDDILKKATEDYGLVFIKKCRSMCG